eukprot:1114416-Pyramimonas_sp.AAC.2
MCAHLFPLPRPRQTAPDNAGTLVAPETLAKKQSGGERSDGRSLGQPPGLSGTRRRRRRGGPGRAFPRALQAQAVPNARRHRARGPGVQGHERPLGARRQGRAFAEKQRSTDRTARARCMSTRAWPSTRRTSLASSW